MHVKLLSGLIAQFEQEMTFYTDPDEIKVRDMV
jgi:hypothetical protein